MKGLGMDEAWNRWMRRFKRLLCTPMWKEWPADDPVNPRPASTNVAKVFLSDFSGIFFFTKYIFAGVGIHPIPPIVQLGNA